MQVIRLLPCPIITPESHPSIGTNINGPSLIRVPDWVPNPLGKYYLYFAHHQGEFIRLAYADALAGPWHIYAPGTLQLAETDCFGHVASPDVHIDQVKRQIVMYFHGPYLTTEQATHTAVTQHFPIVGGQRSFAAISTDGIHFRQASDALGTSYFRLFRWRNHFYALGMPGIVYRSIDGFTDFEQGPTLFGSEMRHAALLLQGDMLSVFYSNAGDCPERILLSTVTLTPDWHTWRPTSPHIVLEPGRPYEGGNLPLIPSQRGAIHEPVRQLRDPCIFKEDERIYLLYSVAGERGIALAEILDV